MELQKSIKKGNIETRYAVNTPKGIVKNYPSTPKGQWLNISK